MRQAPQDPIDKIFAQIPLINQRRKIKGLPAIINLSVGEPYLSINRAILNDLNHFITQPEASNAFHYSPLQGSPSVLAAIIQLYQHYYPALEFTTDEVMICHGATQGVWNALNILLEQGDEVLAFEPYYSAYAAQLAMLGCDLIKIPTLDNSFKPSGKCLEKYLAEHAKAKVLILNYPNNPSGIDLTKHAAIEIAQTLQNYSNINIIIDDVYRELAHETPISILDIDPSLKNRCIIVNSASKGLIGAPGMRIGMVGAKPEWIAQMTNLQAIMVGSISVLTELALVSAINQKISAAPEYATWLKKTKHEYAMNVNYMSVQLRHLGFNVIQGGNSFYVLAAANCLIGKSVPKGIQDIIGNTIFRNDQDIAAYLLHTAGVAVIPGSAFGIAETAAFLRFSCANNLNLLKQAIVNLEVALDGCAARQEHTVEIIY